MGGPRFLVLGDGEAGVALTALLPGALLAPSSPPRPDLSARGVPVPAGPRYLHAGPGADALLLRAGLRARSVQTREVRFAYTAEGRTVDAAEVPAAWRDLYWTKSRPGEAGPPPASAASAGAGSLEVSGADYWDVLRLLRARLAAEGRILPYAAPPRDPDPDAAWAHPDARGPLRVLYTCPPSALWPDFPVRALNKVFAAARPTRDVLLHWPGQRFEYAYRPGPEVPWHRETLASDPDAGPAVVLEWTLPAGADVSPAALSALAEGLPLLAPPALLRGAQVLPSARPAPSGSAWIPVGRLAERRHGLLVTDVAEAALRLARG